MRSSHRTGWLTIILLEGILVCALALYFHCAWLYADRDNPTYYSELTQAFIGGHTYLPEAPPKELLALPNPYDPAARDLAHLRPHIDFMWDTALYNGHYYLYYGPVPALLSIPAKLAGIDLSDRHLALLFCAVGTYFLQWLIIAIFSKQPSVVRWGAVYATIAICFGTWIPLLLVRPAFYEVAIAGAYCFMVLGVCCLWQSAYAQKRRRWKILGSLCFGLAMGCRIFHGINILILLALWLKSSVRNRWKNALFYGAPWALCLVGLAVYNYERFGSIFESGVAYQLTIDNFQNYSQFWQLPNLWHNFYGYFLEPLPWASLLFRHPDFGKMINWPDPYGLWVNNPFSLWSLWFFFNIRACKSMLRDAYRLVIGIALYALGIIAFVLLYHFAFNRFLVDFSPWIMLLATLGYMHALLTALRRWQPLLLLIGGIMALASIYTAIGSGYCGFWPCG